MNEKIQTLEEMKTFLMKHEAGNYEGKDAWTLWNNLMTQLDHMIVEAKKDEQTKITLFEEKLYEDHLNNVMVEVQE